MATRPDTINKLIRLPEVQELTGLGRSAIYDMAGRNEFPAPVKISVRASAWVECEVIEWIDSRIAQRKQGGVA